MFLNRQSFKAKESNTTLSTVDPHVLQASIIQIGQECSHLSHRTKDELLTTEQIDQVFSSKLATVIGTVSNSVRRKKVALSLEEKLVILDCLLKDENGIKLASVCIQNVVCVYIYRY